MSWIQKLHDTYEECAHAPQFDNQPLMPVSHTAQQTHIEVVLDQHGGFQRAILVAKETIVIPASEASAGRVGIKPPPHPLCDKIQYCAGDYKLFGGEKEPFFEDYSKQLREWFNVDPNPKVGAVLNYVERRSLVADLVKEGLVCCGNHGLLLTEWVSDAPVPGLFKMLTPKDGKRDQGDAFVRWRVQVPGDPVSAVWQDVSVRDSWIRLDASRKTSHGLCMVTGETAALSSSHPKRLRHSADGAKLISSNDLSGFTFRGRVSLSNQACGVGSVVSQKAHNALRWLIARQGYKADDQAFVAWTIRGKGIPDPLADTACLLEAVEIGDAPIAYRGDAGQHFALRLSKAIAGYQAELGPKDDVVILGLDSATPGRMAITYYRELTGLDFLERVSHWHSAYSWFQRYSKDKKYVGAPAPRDIAEAAYGRRLDGKLRKATVERLLPCIIDARPLPHDLLIATVRRAHNRAGAEAWEWEKCLGIACALFRGSRKEEKYEMALEENRTTRDYLFGRLLAIAENIEQRALRVANENRDTNASKLMHRFADHPNSTWRNIERALTPYKNRLRSQRPAVLLQRDKLLDGVMGMFRTDDFISDDKLTGEFLLGYHCQRAALWTKPITETESGGTTDQKLAAEGENE